MDALFVRGWKKDKFDHRDFKHKITAPEQVPDNDMLDKLPAVRQQGNLGSCVGFGIGGNLTACAMQAKVDTEWFSPTWIYNWARAVEGTLSYDEGCEPRDALDMLLKYGCLKEHFWPYNGNKLDKKSPPSSLWPEAAKWPIKAYYRADTGTDGICSALASGLNTPTRVSIGIPWPEKWMDSSNGVLPTIKESDYVAGGHEVWLYGYDKKAQRFYGMNSWGTTEWGNKGLFTMPFQAFEIFKTWGGYDAHYVEMAWGTPNPQPEPTPIPNGTYNVSGTLTLVPK